MGLMKCFVVISVLVASVSVLLTFECMSEYKKQLIENEGVQNLIKHLPEALKSYLKSENQISTKNKGVKVLTKEELKLYDGTKGSKGLYLAIMGKVFDVSRGEKHYGPGKGYGFFAGKDGSKAFVTGEFNEAGLIDDVSELSNSQHLDLLHWLSFYEKDYTYVGLLEGYFYDIDGNPTQALLNAEKAIEAGNKEKALEADDKNKFPPCNSEWSKNSGGRVWCSNMSGGIKRDWIGVPRRYHKPGKSVRCACVRTEGPPTDNPHAKTTNGDLDNPNFKTYPDCKTLSKSCSVGE